MIFVAAFGKMPRFFWRLADFSSKSYSSTFSLESTELSTPSPETKSVTKFSMGVCHAVKH